MRTSSSNMSMLTAVVCGTSVKWHFAEGNLLLLTNNKAITSAGMVTQSICTCIELVSGDLKWLDLQSECVERKAWHHSQSLLCVAHVGASQGAAQVVQTAVTGRDGSCGEGKISHSWIKLIRAKTKSHVASDKWRTNGISPVSQQGYSTQVVLLARGVLRRQFEWKKMCIHTLKWKHYRATCSTGAGRSYQSKGEVERGDLPLCQNQGSTAGFTWAWWSCQIGSQV